MNRPGITLLLIEDNPADADLLAELLETVNNLSLHLIHVVTFTTALQRLAEQPFDVILLDLSLPDVEGLDALRQLYQQAPGTPIMVLTGLNDDATAMATMRQGAQDYLVKGTSFLSPTLLTEAGGGKLLVRAIQYAIERGQLLEQLRQSQELAQVTLNSIGDAVITTDAVGKVKSLNPKAEMLTGYSLAMAQGQPIDQVCPLLDSTTHLPVDSPAMTALQDGQLVKLSQPSILVSTQDTEFAVSCSAAPIRASNHQILGTVVVLHDVTEEHKTARQLTWQASHDTLTRLFNREKFNQCLAEVIHDVRTNRAHHILCYLDLDHFKIVNDTCGHEAGDELLRQIANLLHRKVRKSDMLARLGGDEFGLLLYHCPLEQGVQVANLLCKAVQNFRFSWQERVFTIGVSIGLVALSPDRSDLDQAIRLADAACYGAKHAGRNQVHVDPAQRYPGATAARGHAMDPASEPSLRGTPVLFICAGCDCVDSSCSRGGGTSTQGGQDV